MQETRPAKSDINWPIVHKCGNVAKSTTLLNASGGMSGHWITGYQLDGTLKNERGFYLLRRSCLYFNTDVAWTVSDGDTLDIAVEATGHVALEMWIYVPAATTAVASLLVRGDAANTGYKLEITSDGFAKFTIKDGSNACTITGTTSIFGGWHLVSVVCERDSTTGLQIYIDGVADATTAVDTTAMNNAINPNNDLVITGVSNKSMYVGPLGFYTGASAALSAATVLANYNNGIGRKYDGSETGLVLAWNNDEGTGSTCYCIQNTNAYKAALGAVSWSPSKQAGATAAVKKCGPPFRKQYEDDADNPLPAVGQFAIGESSAPSPVVVTFPQAIKIGRNNPVRILETDGQWSLILHGFTADS